MSQYETRFEEAKGLAPKSIQLVLLGPETQSKLTIRSSYVPNGWFTPEVSVGIVSPLALRFWMVSLIETPCSLLVNDPGTCQHASTHAGHAPSRVKMCSETFTTLVQSECLYFFPDKVDMLQIYLTALCNIFAKLITRPISTTTATASIRQYSRITVYTVTIPPSLEASCLLLVSIPSSVIYPNSKVDQTIREKITRCVRV
jgi:hypothetical protein